MNNQSGVYCIEIVENNQFYIGSSKNLRIRFNLHHSHINSKNYRHGNKVLIDEFHSGKTIKYSILEITDDYLDREQFWINDFKSNNKQLINIFDADRLNSSIPESFRSTMSQVHKNNWKDSSYRELKLEQGKATRFTPERLNKEVLVFKKEKYFNTFPSATIASEVMHLNRISLASAARGKYRNSHYYKGYKFIYKEVLYKLGELREQPEVVNPDLSKSLDKVDLKEQRIVGEPNNNPTTSAQHSIFNDFE